MSFVSRTLKIFVKGFALMIFIGALLGLVDMILDYYQPLQGWLFPELIADVWRGTVSFVLFLLTCLVGGMIWDKIHLFRVFKKLPVIRGFYNSQADLPEAIRGGTPALLSPDGQTFLAAIFMGRQNIEINGQPKECCRVVLPNVPIPLTGFGEYFPADWVYIVINVSLSEWMSNYITLLAREIKPPIKAIPYQETRTAQTS